MNETHHKEGEEMLARLLIERTETVGSDHDVSEVNTSGAIVETLEADEHQQEVVASATPQQIDQHSIPSITASAKVDKSLISLGFFTPSSRRIKNQKIKRISFTRLVDGKKVEASAEFHPSPVFGLPITADQDKFLALHNIIANRLRDGGRIENPIRFTTAELMRLLNREVRAGKNYRDVVEWLTVMTATTIVSNGTVYEKGKERYAHDVFHVFDRATSFGKQLPDGSIADANYVWLSQWQLENINHKFLLPIDLLVYRELKNHIAKALVPLLQIWLFASQRAGSFEKRYDELCEMLSLQSYRTPSRITQQLKASLDELTHHGYLEKWRIERTADKRFYKVIFFHGPKFHRDRRRRQLEKERAEAPLVVAQSEPNEASLPEPGKLESPPALAGAAQMHGVAVEQGRTDVAGESIAAKHDARTDGFRSELVEQLSARGLMPASALKLLQSVPGERLEDVRDYIDYWDETKRTKDVGEGFLYNLIKSGDTLPSSFETRKQREERQERQRREGNFRILQDEMRRRYAKHCSAMVDSFIAEELGQEEFQKRVEQRSHELLKEGGLWEGLNKPDLLIGVATGDVRRTLSAGVVETYKDFYGREVPTVLERLHLRAADVGLMLVKKSDPEGVGAGETFPDEGRSI
jgi:hypothetical protein